MPEYGGFQNASFGSADEPMHVRPIFSFLAEKLEAGCRCALITVIGVTGASTRNPGTHMAVAEDGSFIGSLSGGCIEAAVVAESRATIKAGQPREVSFGAGSRFIDLRLPCGGRIDLLIVPLTDVAFIRQLMAIIEQRAPFALTLPRTDGVVSVEIRLCGARLSIDTDQIIVAHVPDLHLVISGHGASVTALARLAVALGVDSLVVSPDPLNIAQANTLGVRTHVLTMPTDRAPVLDGWTAAVFLFHEHEWEGPQLAAALASSAFFVGAMGSVKTHGARLAELAALGVPESDRARIVAPIGLIPSSRDPETLALSTLTQVVAAYHARTAQRAGEADTHTGNCTASSAGEFIMDGGA